MRIKERWILKIKIKIRRKLNIFGKHKPYAQIIKKNPSKRLYLKGGE